ncbi:MAG: nuclear transport factor 2 family protein [Alphaproteobacteria bacterium]|nr:nuclear transport factor 2 family protein [Alphaproteobacteria bacterium]
MRLKLNALLIAVAVAATPTLAAERPICAPQSVVLTGKAAVERNLKTVGAIYEAFGKGNVPGILGCISPKAKWESWGGNSAQRAGVPWMKEQHGSDGVAAFFAYIGKWKVNGFAVKNVMASGANVAAEVEVDFEVTQTGGRIQDEELHYWTFDERGRVTGLRHYSDTAEHIAAFRGKQN